MAPYGVGCIYQNVITLIITLVEENYYVGAEGALARTPGCSHLTCRLLSFK